jgi:hypothetical protein
MPHKIVKSIPVPGPQGLDITQDGSKVWVTTASQQVFSIDTASLAATRYMLPSYVSGFGLQIAAWKGNQIFALADGTLLISTMFDYSSFMVSQLGSSSVAIWDPGTNKLTGIGSLGGVASWGYLVRSGDGKSVYSIAEDSGGESFSYNVLTKTLSPTTELGGGTTGAAVNFDGSRVVVNDANGLNMYDGNLNLIGPLPGGGGIGSFFKGGLLFSPDNTTLYEETMPNNTPMIESVDANTLQVLGIAPAMRLISANSPINPPSGVTLPVYVPVPFAVDKTGMLLGVQYWGIAFEDSTFFVNISPNEQGTPTFMQHMSPYSGPLAGGTTSAFANGTTFTPDVWYGANRGTATASSTALTITSPAASVSGPVNLKLLFPDGLEVFDPLFFEYGSTSQYAILSGASPDGGVPGEISGYGLPTDPSGGTVTVGGNAATIASHTLQYRPSIGAPFPSTSLGFTVPSGSPGWADITVNTPNGSGVLPKGLFYAKSVTDYASPGLR